VPVDDHPAATQPAHYPHNQKHWYTWWILKKHNYKLGTLHICVINLMGICFECDLYKKDIFYFVIKDEVDFAFSLKLGQSNEIMGEVVSNLSTF
jgi:hypothetical protein